MVCLLTIMAAGIELINLMRKAVWSLTSRLLLLLPLVCLTFFINSCDDSNDSVSPGVETLIDDIVECEMLEKQVPGVSISVVRNGEALYQQGYGKADIEAGTDVTPETIFAIGSVTKVFTAIGVLRQYDAGQVDLDEAIGTYLPDLPNEEWKERTVRDLLAMSSGIPEYAFCKGGPKDGEACEDHPQGSPFVFNPCGEGSVCEGANRVPYPQYLDGAAQIPLQFPGGDQYFYTNTNFIILGELIAATSGIGYEDYINDFILGPLEMTSTRPNNVPPPAIPGLAPGYAHVAPGTEGALPCVELADPPDNCSGQIPTNVACKAIPTDDLRLPDQSFSAGWLITNQRDFTKFERALHALSPELLELETYALMWTNTELNDGSFERFGLGWDVCSELDDADCPKPVDPIIGGELLPGAEVTTGKVVSKDGGVPGYSAAIVRYLDDGITVLVLANTLESSGPLQFSPVALAAAIAEVVRDGD